MAFSWTEDISVGASIDSADITEIRTNVDSVDDNKCSSDNSTDNSDHDSSVQGDEGTYKSNHEGSYLSGNNGTVHSGDNITYI